MESNAKPVEERIQCPRKLTCISHGTRYAWERQSPDWRFTVRQSGDWRSQVSNHAVRTQCASRLGGDPSRITLKGRPFRALALRRPGELVRNTANPHS